MKQGAVGNKNLSDNLLSLLELPVVKENELLAIGANSFTGKAETVVPQARLKYRL